MEMLLLGLAGCTGMDVVSILKKKRQDLQAFKIRVRGKRAEQHPRVYTLIEVTYLLWGENLDAKAVERAIELSEKKYCSASAMLNAVAEIRSSYEIYAPEETINPN
jgi:putative redox protein